MSSHMPSAEFENTVRRGLSDLAGDVTAPVLRLRARKRVRTHQALTALATLLVVGITAAGALTVLGTEPERYVRVGGGRLLNTRGAGGQFPCSDEQMEMPGGGQRCVAVGSYRGVDWSLAASLDPKHGLCLWTGTSGGGNLAAGAGGSCDEYTEGGITLSESRLGDLPMLAVGAVPGATERLFLEHGGDDRFELQVYPTPANFPLDLKFYLVWLPDDAQNLLAYNRSGDVIAERRLDGAEPGKSQETKHFVVERGEIEGVAWTLESYGDVIDGRETVCTALILGDAEPANTCHGSFDGRGLSVTVAYPSELPGRAVVSGVMSSKIEELILQLKKGEDTGTAILRAPEPVEPALEFVMGFPTVGDDGTIAGRIVGRDGSSRKVAEQRLP